MCCEVVMLVFFYDEGVRLVEMKDFEEVYKKVGVSIVWGLVVEVFEVFWNDIGGLYEVKVKFYIFW